MSDDDDILSPQTMNFDDLLVDDSHHDFGSPHHHHHQMNGGFNSRSRSAADIWSNQDNLYGISNYGGIGDGYSSFGIDHWLPSGDYNGVESNHTTTLLDLLTAPLGQNNGLDSGSELHSGMLDGSNGFDFRHLTADGESMYADAFSRWDTASDNVYDPFKSGSVINGLGEVKQNVSRTSYREKSPLRRSQSASMRPTFADIAKKPTPPGSEPTASPTLSKEGPNYESEESLPSLQGKKMTSSSTKVKAFRPAHAKHGYGVPLPIQPDSKYGLDDFEVPSSGGKMERSFSCNDALDDSRLDRSDNLELSEDADGDSCSVETSSSKASVNDLSSTPAKSENGGAWFDPKRIFMSNGNNRSRSESEPCNNLLNNNAAKVLSGGKNSRRTNAAYINNLHDGHRSTKQTNTDRAGKSAASESCSNGTSTTGTSMSNSALNPEAADEEAANNSGRKCNGYQTRARTSENDEDMESESAVIDDAPSSTVQGSKVVAMQIFNYLLLSIIFVLGLVGQLYLAVKVGLNSGSPTEHDYKSFAEKGEALKFGLDENIKLPETSDEAMKRLLTCGHKDAYSILGLRSDASDEEIKRFYRRQAILVHPDKNQQPGAEEAFKILGQAFELIGSPEKRTLYDRKIQEEKLSEDVIRQFNDLLTKFQEKMEEASNWIQCNSCGDKHRRYLTDKPVYSARKCNRCQCHHAAKEGDIWAETTFMGFKWHFYACMENRIYDVTAWVSCQPSMVDKFQPNAHMVRLRMGLTNNNAKGPSKNGSQDPSREADLEHLLKNLFPHNHSAHMNTPTANGTRHTSSTDTPKTASTNSTSKKAGKRRARRR